MESWEADKLAAKNGSKAVNNVQVNKTINVGSGDLLSMDLSERKGWQLATQFF